MGTRLFNLFYVIIAFSFLCADETEAWNSGKIYGENIKNHYGNNMRTELFEPLTSDASFRTQDGSSTFRANMTCNDTPTSFMTVSYTTGSPRNGVIPIVHVDRDLDGTKEYHFISPYVASGLCINGIVSCTGGDFQGSCTYYKWFYDGGALQLTESDRAQMSGCACVNDSCGGQASNLRDSTVTTIAHGIYAVMSQYNSAYIVSQTQLTSGTVEYFGQNVRNCTNYQSGTPPSTGVNTTIDPSTELLAQSDSNRSSYSALLGSSSNYATNSPNISNQTNTTISASRNTRTTLTYQEGTTDFSTQSQTNTTISSHIGIPLTQENTLYCQVQWIADTNAVFTDDQTSSMAQYRIETRECTNSICPYQPSAGESIKHDCGNIDNFSEATSAFSALQELANDITCGSL